MQVSNATQPMESSKKSSKKIFDAIKENPNITLQEMADSVGLSIAGVRKNLDKLRKSGTIKRVGPDKGGYWEIVGKDLLVLNPYSRGLKKCIHNRD